MTADPRWANEFSALARSYWTEERIVDLMGEKSLLVSPDRAAPLLRAMGILHRDASMPPPQRRKFFQLNHMLRLMRPPLEELMAAGEPLHLVDAGCGRSYLTIALAWCLENVFEHPYALLGVDRNATLIAECRRRSELSGLSEGLRFVGADLAETDLPAVWRSAFDSDMRLDGVVALHACDTATDDAILLGLEHDATLIAVAPCCQAELASRWAALAEAEVDGAFAPLWNTPHLRREIAATMTDTFRKLLLEGAGFETRAVEFVASAHTPKNTLIRAIRRGDQNEEALAIYARLRRETGGAGIKLECAFDRAW